jgi:hypothetical protein
MQLLIYHGSEPRKTLVAIAEVEWEGATLGVGTIDLKGNTGLTELVYECVGAAFKSHFGKKNPPKDIPVNETTFCRLLEDEKDRPVS